MYHLKKNLTKNLKVIAIKIKNPGTIVQKSFFLRMETLNV